MTRQDKMRELSEAQLAFFIWSALLASNSPLKSWRTISDVVGWLEGEWVDDEYKLF